MFLKKVAELKKWQNDRDNQQKQSTSNISVRSSSRIRDRKAMLN